jgi:hypothetical protein
MTTPPLLRRLPVLLALAALALVSPARAQDDAPTTWKDAQAALKDAVRDTVGHGDDPDKLAALGRMQLRVGRLNDADKVLRRVQAARPNDRDALAGLGKIALYRHDLARAESLLAAAGDNDGAKRDLYALRLRRGDWKGAAELAEAAGDDGQLPMLERLQQLDAYALLPGTESTSIGFDRLFPAPLVRVKLNGQQVLAVIDPGCPSVIVDRSASKLQKLELLPGERSVSWIGSRMAVHNAIAQKIDLGGIVLTNVPVAVASLHRYSLDVNPQGRDIGLVIGLPLLERLGTAIDFKRQRLELSRAPAVAPAKAPRVPFERWSDNQLVVWGSVGGGRKMSLVFGTGLPAAGFGSTAEVFEELGLRTGVMGSLMSGAGVALQGRPWKRIGVPPLALGSVVGDRVNGWLGAMDPGETWHNGVRLDAILGPDWFSGRRIPFDWVKHEITFEGD